MRALDRSPRFARQLAPRQPSKKVGIDFLIDIVDYLTQRIPATCKRQDSPDNMKEGSMVWLKTLLSNTYPCSTCCWRDALFNGMCTECAGDLNVETLRDMVGGRA